MSTAYVIIGTAGAYSGMRTWVVCVHQDRATAEAYIARLLAQLKTFYATVTEQTWDGETERRIAEIITLDPKCDIDSCSIPFRPRDNTYNTDYELVETDLL